VSLRIFLFVHDRGRESLFICLSLEDLFLYSTSRDEAIDETLKVGLRFVVGLFCKYAYTLSVGRHATLELVLVDQQQDSNLENNEPRLVPNVGGALTRIE
jgi:hypothetical protein